MLTPEDRLIYRRLMPVAAHAAYLKADRADAALMLAYSALSRSWRL